MRPRTILYTGKGGVGKTSVAACTARSCAAAGLRTLVLSTDPAHSLGESLEAELTAEPTPVSKGEISLKKIGLELVVAVDGQRRTIILPSALASFRPAGATFEDGALEVKFYGEEQHSRTCGWTRTMHCDDSRRALTARRESRSG